MTQTRDQAREVQLALRSKGHQLGTSGPDHDGVDSDYGPSTHRATLAAIATSPAIGQTAPAPPIIITVPGALTAAQRAKLAGVHVDLVRVLEQAAAMGARFRIDQGVRTLAEQKKLVAAGKSQTLDSRHLTGHAVDLYPLDDVDHDNVPWDWDDFYPLAEQMRAAAVAIGVPLRWGGAWDVTWTAETKSAKATAAGYTARRKAAGRSAFLDGPHFELPAARYP